MILQNTAIAEMAMAQLWQMTLVTLVLGGIAISVARRRPHLAHVLWVLVFLKCLTPPVLSTPWGIFQRQAREAGLVDVLIASYVPSFVPAVHQRPLTAVNLADDGSAGTSHTFQTSSAEPAEQMDWSGIVAGTWLTGMGGFVLVVFGRWSAGYRKLRRSLVPVDPQLVTMIEELRTTLRIRRRFRLLVSRDPVGPMVFGAWRPTIVIPLQLVDGRPLDKIEPILAHEMIHVRRGDTLFGLLQSLALTMWWFHPLVWWASRRANRTCEQCCDEEVVTGLRCRPDFYARVLLNVVELVHQNRPLLPAYGVRSAEITSRRMENLMKADHAFRRRMPKYCWVIGLLAAAVVLPGDSTFVVDRALGATSPAVQQQADQAFAARDWTEASTHYRELVTKNSQDARSWFRLGYALHAAGQVKEAISAHQKASEFPPFRPVALYNLACALALQEKTEESLVALKQAIDAGFWSHQPLAEDADFAVLLERDEFKSLAERAKPPSERGVYRQFDFWVGSWDVIGKQGQKMGTNVITKDEHGFLITEKWTSANGGTGTSINYYDPSVRKWKQTWVSDNGTIVNYSGEFNNGKMQLVGERIFTSGQKGLSRVSFTPLQGSRVHQFIEFSHDGGGTWSTYFDGTYVRNDNAATLN